MDENKVIRPLNVIKDTKNHIGLATEPRLVRLATEPRLVRPATVPRLTALAKTVSSCARVLTQWQKPQKDHG